MTVERITCAESDKLRVGLSPWASCTNYVGGEVLNHDRPPHTRTEWCDDDEVVRLIDVLDADGCRHVLEADMCWKPTMSEERYHRFDGWRTKCEQCNAAQAAWELFIYEGFHNQGWYLYLCDVCKEE